MSKGNVIVCISPEISNLSIIRRAEMFAEQNNKILKIVTVQPKNSSAEKRAKELKILYKLSELTDKSIDIIYSDDAFGSIRSYVEKNNICCLYVENPKILADANKSLGCRIYS